MCGQTGDVKKTKVEGAVLDLCDDCQEVGNVVESSSSTSTTSTSTSSSSSSGSKYGSDREPDEELVEGYGERVKSAREAEDMSVNDMASKLKEKRSVVQRIESGDLTPDRKLARKIESVLQIKLYDDVSPATTQRDNEPQNEATLGDVATVKED